MLASPLQTIAWRTRSRTCIGFARCLRLDVISPLIVIAAVITIMIILSIITAKLLLLKTDSYSSRNNGNCKNNNVIIIMFYHYDYKNGPPQTERHRLNERRNLFLYTEEMTI